MSSESFSLAVELEDDPADELIQAAVGELVVQGIQPMEAWQHDPIGWAVRYLGLREETLRWSLNDGYDSHEWDGTAEPIVELAQAVAKWQWVGVEAGTGTNKSHTLGWLTLWFLACFPSARVFSYAAKEEQLELYAWTEIRRFWPRFRRLFPMARMSNSPKALWIRMQGGAAEGEEAGWGAVGRAAAVRADEEVAHKAAGMHGEHMLILVEEGPGVPQPIMRALTNTCTSPHNIIVTVGNPDHQHDTLHQFCIRPNVTHVRISALDHPNVVANQARDPAQEDILGDELVVPGAVSRKSIIDRAQTDPPGSRLYESRVRGVSPAQAADAIIRQDWIDRAVELWMDLDMRLRLAAVGGGAMALGVDVADSEEGDEAAIARGRGAVLTEVIAFPNPSAAALGVRVALEMAADEIGDRRVGVDSVGVGGTTVNKLKELGRHIQALNAGTKAVKRIDRDVLADEEVAVLEEEEYYNLRSQLWWTLRRDLQQGRLALPPDPVLHRELVMPTWEPRNGKILVEPKDKIRERLGRSPDRADAVVIWNWVRPRPEKEPEDEPKGAWDPEILESERDHIYRVREPQVRDNDFDPMQVDF